MRTGLLVNPTAGRRRAAGHHLAVAEALKDAGHRVVDLTGPDAETARSAPSWWDSSTRRSGSRP